ncbi:DNA alkylation repair protein [Bermanella sp. R86510]|uniref:DNA alkylation repair protein n=1 Tax=unclassified Bermanella TaxID=2627862 RepID=UPI0037CAD3F7
MAEMFKDNLGEKAIRHISNAIKHHHSVFDDSGFVEFCLYDLDNLSLMQRNRKIAEGLVEFLPADFSKACDIIVSSLAPHPKTRKESDQPFLMIAGNGVTSWQSLPLAEFVGRYGTQNLDTALNALTQITPHFSAEFAIRYLILADEKYVLKTLIQWCDHHDYHVRRLASEGSRPRLPWGFQLTSFISEPTKTMPILERLRDDESDYVRLSVANHLNDIAKDHPDRLQKSLQSWCDEKNSQRMKIVRHACRTLIKKGHQPTLKMLGYQPIDVTNVNLKIENTKIKYGDSLVFSCSFKGNKQQPVIVDYAIHFQKASGKLSAKVFKWKTTQLTGSGDFNATKVHKIKPITTRRYYNGKHLLEVLVNGKSIAQMPFHLHGVD